MSIIDILIILGCLAGGYWIVSSVLGPGVDIMRRDGAHNEAPDHRTAPGKSRARRQLPNPREADWHLLLDVPRSANRPEIEAACKRQLDKALAARDTVLHQKLQQAREAGLAQLSRPDSLRH